MISVQGFLDKNGFVLEESGRIVLTGSNADIENYIEIEENNNVFNVLEVHRADKVLRKQTDKKNKAIILAVVLFKKIFDNVSDRNVAHVVFNGRYIVKDATISRTYVVLYNYCRNLQEIRKFFRDNKKIFLENNIGYQEVIELYMFL